jgi:hypothetical protein
MTFSLSDMAFVGSLTSPSAFDFLNPANIGLPVGGGYFAGLISHTANGNPTHALIVAPKESGATGPGYPLTTSLSWKTGATATTGTNSPFDGAANTAAMVAAGIDNHPAAKFCVDLRIGGLTDWYLASRFEKDIAFFNLKPSTAANNTSWGANIYSVPPKSNNTSSIPAQTGAANFNTSFQAFAPFTHWSSTEATATAAWILNMGAGFQSTDNKLTLNAVRAFRRIAL